MSISKTIKAASYKLLKLHYYFAVVTAQATRAKKTNKKASQFHRTGWTEFDVFTVLIVATE